MFLSEDDLSIKDVGIVLKLLTILAINIYYNILAKPYVNKWRNDLGKMLNNENRYLSLI